QTCEKLCRLQYHLRRGRTRDCSQGSRRSLQCRDQDHFDVETRCRLDREWPKTSGAEFRRYGRQSLDRIDQAVRYRTGSCGAEGVQIVNTKKMTIEILRRLTSGRATRAVLSA